MAAKDTAWGLGVVAFLFFVMAGALQYGYFPSGVLEGLTSTAFVVFGVLSMIAAVAFYLRGDSRAPRFGGFR